MEPVKHLYKTYIKSISIDDLDLVLYEEFNVDMDNGQDCEIIEDQCGSVCTHPISIDTMIGEMIKLKEKGATHISLDYHEDHIGYDVSAFNIKVATSEEVNNFIKDKTAREIKEQKRADLQRQLRELDEDKSRHSNDDLPF
jgi:hypothetical protein